ncbi:MAG: hypothetical protein QM622_08680 [Microbacterium sp.]
MSAPTSATPWHPLTPVEVAGLLSTTDARWWLSGGAALDRWLGAPIRERVNIDVSTTRSHLPTLITALPTGYTAWVSPGSGDAATGSASRHAVSQPPGYGRTNPGGSHAGWRLAQVVEADADVQRVHILRDADEAWVLQVNVEDGVDRAWLYLRDPRLQLPWDAAVLNLDGIPTGAPEVQLVWKALRPRPEDEIDKDAVLPKLPEAARAWWEKAILSIHPHSTWSIHVRSPFAPAKASWNRSRRS